MSTDTRQRGSQRCAGGRDCLIRHEGGYGADRMSVTSLAASIEPKSIARGIAKSPTGIIGLDELTGGGLPAGRPTLICGGAGCGKTLLATTFLVNGAVDYGEGGVFVSFEERAEDLAKNVASLGYDLDRLIADGKLAVDYVRVERSEIEETGEYDLEALFIRL